MLLSGLWEYQDKVYRDNIQKMLKDAEISRLIEFLRPIFDREMWRDKGILVGI